MTASGSDRRGGPRHHRFDAHGILSAIIRPGHKVVLLNISAGGALVETPHRLRPGSPVDLLVDRKQARANVRGRVQRCAVSRVHPSAIAYRGAIVFDQSLPWFVEDERMDNGPEIA